jgi:lipopolysaccharide/colanic/teichoic acid biosynthesis glycosyltransferase
MIKRIFDVSIAVGLLIILSPLMLLTASLLMFNLGLPILFKQARPGLLGRPFLMYKFRTMHEKTDTNGKSLSDNLRITNFGSHLRSSSLDELPSLWNVLKGEMSLVGPRPLLLEYLSLYNKKQARRHDVKPGMTGWAQINGRNSLSWAKKFELDLWYVDNQTFFLDLKILLITLKKVLLREGVTEIGQVTMSKFKGNTK